VFPAQVFRTALYYLWSRAYLWCTWSHWKLSPIEHDCT